MLEDDTLDVRLAAAEQLGAMRDQSGAAVVLEFLKSPPASTDQLEAERRKVRAARAVGSIGTADLAAFLPQLLEDASPVVRLAAAKSVLQLAK
jgi:HEAT repeat protein